MMFNTKNRILLIVIFGLALIAGATYLLVSGSKDPSDMPTYALASFEECAAAGYPIMESYPRQCRDGSGKLHVEEIDEPVGESWGTIMGTVMLGPTCPVEMDPPDPKCADKPYEINLAITTADQSRVIKEVRSDAAGRFRVELPAGEYAIRSAAVANILPYCASNGTIRVPINDTVEVSVSCDTGIR